MRKNQLIDVLQRIVGDPEVYIKDATAGDTFKITSPEEIELVLCEKVGKDVYTFSLDRKKELGIDDECIVIWIDN